MAKFTNSELKRSLLDGLTLMQGTESGEFVWCEYYEIDTNIAFGFKIFNDEKKELFSKIQK
jgi:hypothetical protein